MRRLIICVVAACLASASSAAGSQNYKLLYSFTGGSDGSHPEFGLTAGGSTMYGVTGGPALDYAGNIFKINADGSGYTVLHTFAGGSSDGFTPGNSLVLSGSTLYGVTTAGGSSNKGTVFKIDTNGGGFSVLYSFTGGNDGHDPNGLAVSGSTLYGMTDGWGGVNGAGTIFKINTNGTGFTTLHKFNYSDGVSPTGNPIISGSTLYGATLDGGAAGCQGTVFKVNTDGGSFATLHSFAGNTDGWSPNGNLALSGSDLYGVTAGGPTPSGRGVIFKLGIDTRAYSVLHQCLGNGSDAGGPQGAVLFGSNLFTAGYSGGSRDWGALVGVDTATRRTSLLHSFTDYPSDGSRPNGNLTLNGSTLYGTTLGGGSYGGGAIFSLVVPEPSACALLGVAVVALAAFRLRRKLSEK